MKNAPISRMLETSTTVLFSLMFASTTQAGSIEIADCGTTITTSGDYKLTGDLMSCPGVAITIAASDVRLDLKRNKISCDRLDGRDDLGILALGVSDIVVRNGSIFGCDGGILFDGTQDSTVRNVTLHSNLLDPITGIGFGIVAFEANRNTITHNRAFANTTGIELFFGGDNQIVHNVTNSNFRAESSPFPSFGIGIGVAFSHDNVVAFNHASRNTDAGIALANGSTGNAVRNNVTFANDNYGIGMFARVDLGAPLAVGNTIKKNLALANGAADVLEALFDPFADPRESVVEPCMNDWTQNFFVSYIAPQSCFGGN